MPQATRLFYALDFYSAQGPKAAKPTYRRFHGFKENTYHGAPKGVIPRCLHDEAWMKQTNNENIKVKEDPDGLNVDALKVEDNEMFAASLVYVQELESEGYEADVEV